MRKSAITREKTVLGITLYDLVMVAEKLGVSYPTVTQYVKTGRLKGQKFDGKMWVTEDNLLAFINGGICK